MQKDSHLAIQETLTENMVLEVQEIHITLQQIQEIHTFVLLLTSARG
jgi:hypothetical protein